MIRQLSRLSVVGALFALPFLATSAIAQSSGAVPSLTAQFTPDDILPGSISTLTFTINTSPSAVGPTFDLAFSAALPGDVVIAKGDVLLDCAGELVAAEGSSSVTFDDGELPVGGVCTIEVPVSANTAGVHTLTTSTLASDQGAGAAATDDLTVLAPDVTITSSLSSSTVTPGNTVRMSYDYTLSSGFEAFTLNSTLPDGLVIATPSGVSSTCSGTFEATPGGTSFSISDAGIAATTCTVGFDLRAVDRGTYVIDTDFATTFNFPSLSATLRNELTVPSLPSDGVAFDKSFSVSQAPAGDTVQLTFKLQNGSRSVSATDLAFTDDLDGFLSGAVATGPLPSNPCGSGSSITGTSNLTFSGGSLAPGAICEFSVDVALPSGVTGNSTYTNTSSALTGTLDGAPYTGSTASSSLKVVGTGFLPVFLTKTFTDDPVAPGDPATIEYVLTNPNTADAASSVMFTDYLSIPTGLSVVATPQCGGAFSLGAPGLDVELTFSGGTVAANSSCTMTVAATVPSGTAPGDYSSSTGAVTATVNGNAVESASASDSLQILGGANLSFTKSFVDDQAAAPGQTQILFTIESGAESASTATNIAFTDDLNAFLTGTEWSATPTNECRGAMTGTSTLSYSGGSIAPGESCDILVTVNLAAATTGTYTNTTSGLTATAGGQATTALAVSDDIFVFAGGVLTTSMEFLQDPYVAASGDPLTIRYTLDNTAGSSAYTSVSFTEDFRSSATLLASLTVNFPVTGATCGAGASFVGSVGDTFLSATGLEVPAGGICTFDVELNVGATPTADDYPFSTSTVSAQTGGSTVFLPALKALLNVADGNLLVTKSYATNPVQAGDTTVAEYTITNTLSEAIDTIVFFDEVDNLFPGLAATGLPKSACGGTLSGTGTVQLSNGSLAANASCTFSATLQTPASTPPDTYTSSTATVTAQTVASGTALTGGSVSKSLQVVEPATASFAKSFAPTAVGASGTTTLTYVITNLDSGSAISDIQFSDDLNDALSGLVASGLPLSDVCGSGSSLTGTGTLSLTNASLAASQSCTINVTVQVPSSATPGSYTSTSGALISNGLTLDDAASASFLVEPAPGFAQVISPNAIVQGGGTTITYTIDNSASSVAATSLSFSNSYPALMLNAAAPNASTTCTGGTLTAAAGTGTLSFSGGTVAAGTTCTVQVDVQASAASGQTNTSSALTSSLGDSGTSSAALAITAAPVPTFSKSFASPSLALNSSVAMTLTINNTGALVPATSLNVSDNLPAGMVVATSPNASTTCSGGTLTASANSSSVSYSGGTVNAAQSCTIVVDVTATSAGTLVNTTGQLTSSLGNSGTANASLRIPSITLTTPLTADNIITSAEAGAVTLAGTTSLVENGRTVSIQITDGASVAHAFSATVSGNAWTTSGDLSALADGAATLSVTTSDANGSAAGPVTHAFSIDATAPTGHSVAFDQPAIISDNELVGSFSFAGAEVGATYSYTIWSSGGGTNVTGSGTIATATDQIGGLDLSALADGTLTLTVVLVDPHGNISAAVTDTISKDVAVPSVVFDTPLATDDLIDQGEVPAVVVSGTASGVEDGQTVSITITDITPTTRNATATVTGGVWSVTVDMSGLSDGALSLTADVSDVAGNPAAQANKSLSLDATVPVGFGAVFDSLVINDANQTAASFSFVGAELGATYNFTISSSAGGPDVTGTGTIATATDQIIALDLSGLADGTLTLSAVLTDGFGNAAAAVTDTLEKDAEIPSVELGTVVAGDNIVNGTEQTAVSIAGTTSDVEDGQMVTVVVTDSSAAFVTGLATVSGSVFSVSLDLSSLVEGALAVTADVSDASGNAALQATLGLFKDTIAPSGQAIAFDQSPVTAANQTAIDLTFSGAEIGSDYALMLSSTGGGATLSSNGTVLAQNEQLTGFDLSGLSDGTVTASVVLIDAAGNASSAATASVIKETSVPTVVLTGPTGPISDAFDVTMIFSEPVFNLGIAGFDIAGATATGLTGTGADYILTVLPDHDGEITVTVLGNAAQDAQGNPSEASAVITVTADLTGTPDPVAATDSDGDGVPDTYESSSADRDGDGVPDASDYDPAGYFYCEDDGRILSGGGITVSGPSGSNSSVGIANDINIVQDGSTGFYQWFAQRPGTYTVIYRYPMDAGLASTARLSSGTLDVTSLLPANPAVLGSTEFGNSGFLADSSLSANAVFYSSFVIEAGDPNVLANNIPMTQCAENAVVVSATDNGAEANGAATDSISFTVAQDRLSALDTVVSYAMSGTATDGTDYVAASGSLTIPAGNMSVEIELDVLEDGLVEGPELATLTLTAVTSADDVTILSATASSLAGSATITDDDAIGIAVTNDDLTASENGRDTAAMGFSLMGQPAFDVVLNFAGDGQCSVSPSSLTFTSANYASPQRLKIKARDDEDVEGAHTCQPTVSVASTDANFDNYSLALAEVMVADDLVDQIRDPLTEILKDDLEETVRTQQRQFSSIAKGALGRLRDGQDNLPCGTISEPDVDGNLNITDGNGSTTGKFGWENYDCQTSRRNILDGSFSVTWAEDTGTHAILQLSRLSEKYISEREIRGFFWGGYYSRNNVDSTAEGTIDGYGLNGGIYGAKATGTGLFVDYYASAAMGIHNYDLTFDADAGDIDATGSYNYAALFGGVALSGTREFETYSISPRVGLDVAQAWVSDADVTARQLGETDTGTIDLPNFTGGRFFAEIEFAGLSTKQGASTLGQMMTEIRLTPRLACEYSSYGTDPECGAGINFEVTTDDPNENLSYGFEMDYERLDALNRFRLSFSRERRFAGDLGAVVTRLSMPDTTNVTLEHGVKLDF